jgi:hypothetical protein
LCIQHDKKVYGHDQVKKVKTKGNKNAGQKAEKFEGKKFSQIFFALGL